MSRPRLTVLTSIIGGKDTLIDDQVTGRARFVCFTDAPVESRTWDIRPAYNRFHSDRRNSRAPKIMPHQFVDTDISIWIDGSMSLTVPPEELVDRYLGDRTMALVKHPRRDCIFDEATHCVAKGLDDPRLLEEQVDAYKKDGYPARNGLCLCGFMIRRHGKAATEFNNAWWSDYCRYSVRDQISFMYVARKLRLDYNIIDEPFTPSVGTSFFTLTPHRTPQSEPYLPG